jgi:peroxiredoxin/Tfp pilus assembly protein PilF
MSLRSRVTVTLVLVLITACGTLGFSKSASSHTVAQDDATYDTELQKAIEFLQRRKYDDAVKSFKRANDMCDKKSVEALYGLAQAYYGLDAFKNVVETADKALELALDDKHTRAQLYNLKGLAVQAQSELKNEKKLKEAEEIFREGLALSAQVPTLSYNLGVVLLQQKRDEEGVAELMRYVKLAPRGEFAEQAKKMIENPRRAREAFAPDFSFVTAEGEHITLEDLRGKVVVLDFWGTWCPPCVASLPALRSLHKRYTKESSFMLIGISSDRDEEVWKEFTAKEKMVWPQYRDRDRKIQAAFRVNAFPTYIIIDHEGIVRYRSSGMSWEHSADLNNAIKKHMKVVAKESSEN